MYWWHGHGENILAVFVCYAVTPIALVVREIGPQVTSARDLGMLENPEMSGTEWFREAIYVAAWRLILLLVEVICMPIAEMPRPPGIIYIKVAISPHHMQQKTGKWYVTLGTGLTGEWRVSVHCQSHLYMYWWMSTYMVANSFSCSFIGTQVVNIINFILSSPLEFSLLDGIQSHKVPFITSNSNNRLSAM